MTEAEKCRLGLRYDTAFAGREEAHLACADLCYEYNQTRAPEAGGWRIRRSAQTTNR